MYSLEDKQDRWADILKTNQPVPPHISRIPVDSNAGIRKYTFCLQLNSLETVLNCQVESEFQLRITFYDAANGCFFGNPWIGSIVKSTTEGNNLHAIEYGEVVYFHTSINDFTIVLVLELVNTTDTAVETVGWSWIRIFSQYDSLTDTSETVRPKEKRLEFYHGSPLALVQVPEPLEEYPSFIKINGSMLLYTVQTHEALEKVLQYIPENVVVSGDDIIPGVEEEGDAYISIDILKTPQPIRLWPCHLNKVTVTLFPSLEKFEDCLCDYLNQDRLRKDEILPDGSHASVVERKLKVGVHNGWQFVKSPHIVYLEKEYSQPLLTKSKKASSRPASSLSNTTRECIGLSLRSRLELNEMVQHPMFAIAFLLEYVVNIPVSQPELPANKKALNKLGSSFGSIPFAKKASIALRKAIWVPFEQGGINNQIISLELQGGDLLNPFDNMIFSESRGFFEDLHIDSLGKIEFSFHQTRAKKQEASFSKPINKSNDELQAITPLPLNDLASVRDVTMKDEQNALHLKPPLPHQSRLTTQQEIQHLTELPRPQMYSSLLVSAPETKHAVALSRVAHSLLYSVEYPKVTDSQGNSPFLINPEEKVSYSLSLESRDRLHTNEIILQFLAISMCVSRSVFFSFQFYRFPQTTTERLHLKKLDGSDEMGGDHPRVLQRSARDGKPSSSSPPGLIIKYTVDPAFMQVDEKTTFLKYLLDQKLYIDVWDGDSLLLIGSTSTPLKYLLRQSQSAVQVSQELDILFTEYSEDHPTLSGDLVQAGGAYPTGTRVTLTGKLCLRMANVGYLPESNLEKLNHVTDILKKKVVSASTQATEGVRSSLKTRTVAKLMSDCDADLASMLLTRKVDVQGRTEKMRKEQMSSERKRKLDRMKALRQMEGGEKVTSGYVLVAHEKMQRTRDLRTINHYREKAKNHNIHNKLEESITTHHILHTSLGEAEYFEFALKNPFPRDQVVIITSEDQELKVIINSKEWRYFKQLTGTNTAMEDQMFSSANEEGVKLFLRAHETVHVPFKFQSFTSYNVTPEIGPSHPLYTSSYSYSLQTFGKDTTLSSKTIKVTFTGNEMKPVAFLSLNVEIHPHPIHQTFRFYHPEQSFLKKAIRMPPFHAMPGSSIVSEVGSSFLYARCSDDSVICETYQVQASEPQEVFIKVPCGVSPSVKRFFVLVFNEEFCPKPSQIWQFYIHSLQRIDMTATEGQSTKLSVLLKGSKSARMVKCFPSHPAEMKLAPRDPFMLLANGVQELCVKVNALTTGRRMMFLNVVDQEFHQLVKSWLILVSCIPPVISKSFEVHLVVGGGQGANKKISFLNPYPVKKTFHFKTNRTDLLRFKEDNILLGGGITHNIGLCFIPQHSTGEAKVLIFINDRDGKNEETFCVNINYFHSK